MDADPSLLCFSTMDQDLTVPINSDDIDYAYVFLDEPNEGESTMWI
jgi:hypothetical protein